MPSRRIITAEPSAKVALKYCGCCNPRVDLNKIARHLAQLSEEKGIEVVPYSQSGIDIMIILCGCPRACVDKEEVRAKARFSLVIAGEKVGDRLISEECLPSIVVQELGKMLEKLRGSLVKWVVSK